MRYCRKTPLLLKKWCQVIQDTLNHTELQSIWKTNMPYPAQIFQVCPDICAV